MNEANESYEDRSGPLARRAKRLGRGFAWLVKGLVGARRTLLVEASWRLGDEVMALPIYESLRKRYPDCRIQVLCNYPELLEGNPFVDEVNPPSPSPDRYILLRGALRQVYRPEQYAQNAGVPTPAARPTLYYSDWSTDLSLSRAGGSGRVVALSSGATWPTKRWPVEKWRELARSLMDKGCAVVELGAATDEPIGEGRSLLGRTKVREAACVLHHADLFIGCDSGLMHLALAAGTRVLALFGPTEPAILIRNEPRLTTIANGRDCQGCWNRPGMTAEKGVCPLGISSCMGTIAVGDVLRCAEGILASEP